MIKECEFLQHWRLGWSKVPELSLSFGELFDPDGGVVRPWGLGPKLDQTSKHGGCWMFIPLLMMKYVCLGPGAARAARCGHCWAGERVNFGQRNGLKPDPQTDE